MYTIKRLSLILLLSISQLSASYTLVEGKRIKSSIDKMPKNSVGDMRNIPQDPAFYAKQIKSFSKAKQKELDVAYNKKYFKPWDDTRIAIPKKDFGWETRFVTKKPIYRSTGKRISSSIYKGWIYNANMKALNSIRQKAITVRRTNVKALPTTNTFYRDPRRVGEGFPFDYNQNSAHHINVPLFVSHYSRDGKWAFVKGSYAFGWVLKKDIAITDSKFRKKFRNGKYAITIKDNLRLYNGTAHVSLVKLGALFPIAKDKQHYLTAQRSKWGHAQLTKVSVVNKKHIAKKPLAFTSKNVAKIAKEFYGEPYGWGGRNECRDCSATTRDFLAPFGIFLRRNSSKQAKDGKATSIKGLKKSTKKRKIIAKAEPFRSLLYVPGHVVLYLGEYKGEPVIMHTYWGMRKTDGTKLITGRTIITTTEPGKERRDIREGSKLINTLKTIVNF
ncbi:MAG: SH3 domain-containing protein [Campylobacterota bacterium]|nr:SH3 domain-containing protein [Campylobacterota bacterium]